MKKKIEERGPGLTKFLGNLDKFFGEVGDELDKYKIADDPKFDKAHELAVISLRLMQIVKLYEKKNPDRKDSNKDTEVPELEEKQEGYRPERSFTDEMASKRKS